MIPVSGMSSALLADSLTAAGRPTPGWAGWSGAAISGGAVVYSLATLRNEAFLDLGGPIVLGAGAAVGWGLSIAQMRQNRSRLQAVGQWPPTRPARSLRFMPIVAPSYVGLNLRM